MGDCEAVAEGEGFALDALDEGEFCVTRGGVMPFSDGVLFSAFCLIAGGIERLERLPPCVEGLEFGQLLGDGGEVGAGGGGLVFEGFAFLGGEGRVALEQEPLLCDGLFACAMGFEDCFADFFKPNGAGERLEDACAFCVVRVKEGGKIALGEQHGAGELFKGQSDAFLDGRLCFGDFTGSNGLDIVFWEAVTWVEGEVGLLQIAIRFSAGALDGPDGGVDVAVATFEGDFGGAEGATAPEEISRVGLADLLESVVEFCASAPCVETRRFVVEGEAECIEQGCFS